MKCSICGEEIVDVAFIEISAYIVKQDPNNQDPIIFYSPDHRAYYGVKIPMHDRCWIKLIGTKTGLKLEGGLGLIPVSE